MRTVLIMAGGNRGPIFSALAVAEQFREKDWRVVWLGSKIGMESKLVPQYGFEMEWVRFSGLRGKGILRALLLPISLLVALGQSARAIFRVRPDVVLGMGGYISFPGGMMAALLARPLVLHEQNAVAGLANKVLARFADRILVAFPNTMRNAEWTGNPVRRDIAQLVAPEQRYGSRTGNLNILVVGGSLGARVLNETVPRALALMPPSVRPN